VRFSTIFIIDAREMPVLSMLEHIKGQLMARHYSKEKNLEKCGRVLFVQKLGKRLTR
jgi:hypothetical protein